MDHSEKNVRNEDRRTTRTRLALRQALRELVKEKSYATITIEEITERANVGRTTFYLHYRDKEDLFLEDFEKKLSERVENVPMRPLRRWLSSNEDNIVRAIFEIVLENADLFQAITKEQTNQVYNRFRDMHIRAVTKLIQDSPIIQMRAKTIEIPIEFILNYYSGVLWACIVWWVEQGFNPGIDEMTDYFLRMFNPGVIHALGIKNPDILQR